MLDGEILRLRFPIELRILPAHLKVLSDPEFLEPESDKLP
jgi:diacylglycerol kinase family enzyme